jgi:hypothetical protein
MTFDLLKEVGNIVSMFELVSRLVDLNVVVSGYYHLMLCNLGYELIAHWAIGWALDELMVSITVGVRIYYKLNKK